ncbi:Methenyltetrahydrofolate synthase domain-containing protein, partial [Galemys pyrenaicus]
AGAPGQIPPGAGDAVGPPSGQRAGVTRERDVTARDGLRPFRGRALTASPWSRGRLSPHGGGGGRPCARARASRHNRPVTLPSRLPAGETEADSWRHGLARRPFDLTPGAHPPPRTCSSQALFRAPGRRASAPRGFRRSRLAGAGCGDGWPVAAQIVRGPGTLRRPELPRRLPSRRSYACSPGAVHSRVITRGSRTFGGACWVPGLSSGSGLEEERGRADLTGINNTGYLLPYNALTRLAVGTGVPMLEAGVTADDPKQQLVYGTHGLKELTNSTARVNASEWAGWVLLRSRMGCCIPGALFCYRLRLEGQGVAWRGGVAGATEQAPLGAGSTGAWSCLLPADWLHFPVTGVSKQDIRERIWDYMESQNIADFPRPVHNRIPNFKGAPRAADRLPRLQAFRTARTIKVNPDAPQKHARFLVLDGSHLAGQNLRGLEVFSRSQEVKVDPDKPLEGVRLLALQSKKTLLVPTPRLRTGLFNRIAPPPGATKDTLRKCATSQVGARRCPGASRPARSTRGRVPLGLDSRVAVDLVVVGSVAVSEKGWRIGKGEGYADLEYAMMVSMGAAGPDTPVVTIVHDCQVVDIPEGLLEDHDLSVDYILTPTHVVATGRQRPQPTGITWSKVGPGPGLDVPALRLPGPCGAARLAVSAFGPPCPAQEGRGGLHPRPREGGVGLARRSAQVSSRAGPATSLYLTAQPHAPSCHEVEAPGGSVSREMLQKIPVLRSLRLREQQAGKDVGLRGECRQLLETRGWQEAPSHAGRSPPATPQPEVGTAPGPETPLAASDHVGGLPSDNSAREPKSALRGLGSGYRQPTWQGPQGRASLRHQDQAGAQRASSRLQGLHQGARPLRGMPARWGARGLSGSHTAHPRPGLGPAASDAAPMDPHGPKEPVKAMPLF